MIFSKVSMFKNILNNCICNNGIKCYNIDSILYIITFQDYHRDMIYYLTLTLNNVNKNEFINNLNNFDCINMNIATYKETQDKILRDFFTYTITILLRDDTIKVSFNKTDDEKPIISIKRFESRIEYEVKKENDLVGYYTLVKYDFKNKICVVLYNCFNESLRLTNIKIENDIIKYYIVLRDSNDDVFSISKIKVEGDERKFYNLYIIDNLEAKCFNMINTLEEYYGKDLKLLINIK